MGSNTFYGAGLLLGSDAPQARIGCRLNPLRIYAAPRQYGGAGQPAFMRTCRIRGVRRTESAFVPRQRRGRIPMGSDAPQARIGCGFNPAGSARIYAPPYGGGRFPMGSDTVL